MIGKKIWSKIIREFDLLGKRIGKRRGIVQKALNVSSPIASAISVLNPAFLAIPIVSSVANELCTYFDSKSVEKRLHEFEKKLEKQSISIETMQNRINQLSEHGQYVFRNILKHLCLSALPETTDALINCLIAYLMEDKQDMSEELCEIVCSCNANDIQLLRMIKHFLSEGKREFQQKMIAKSQNDISESRTDENENTNKVYTPIRWRDRNVIYGENTIFWPISQSFMN